MTFRGFCFNNTTCHTCVRAQELSQHWERRSCDSSLCIFFNQVHLFSATIESEALTWPTNYEMKLFPLLWPEEGCVYNSISSLAVTGSIGGWKNPQLLRRGGKRKIREVENVLSWWKTGVRSYLFYNKGLRLWTKFLRTYVRAKLQELWDL